MESFVYLKRRTRDLRFSNDNHRVDLVPVDAMLSQSEQEKIADFARAKALDFGGLDVLRDREDGRIYVVDANKTDMGTAFGSVRRRQAEGDAGAR